MAELKLKYVLLIQSIITCFFGLALMFIPNPFLNAMGLATPADIGEPIRFYGAMMFGFSIILFCTRNEPHSSMRQAVLLSFICCFFPQIFFHLFFHPLNNFMVWNLIVADLIFVIIDGYFFIKNRGK